MIPEELEKRRPYDHERELAFWQALGVPVSKRSPYAATVRRDYRCPECGWLGTIRCPLSEPPGLYGCPECGHAPLARYFGATREVAVNYGYRGEGHYATKEDARIAQYQFEHL